MPPKAGGVLPDSSVTGGTKMRGVDVWMSQTFGGYRSGGTGAYANYVEPVLHAAEHTRRGLMNPANRSAELARAKDELRSVGNGGLVAMEQRRHDGHPSYQSGTYQAGAKK